MTRWAKAAAVACVVLAWSCAGDGLRSLFQECDKVGQNTFVRDTMKDIYLWYRELPDLDPAGYDSPEAYLEAIRYKRYDTHFSFIAGKAADTAYYSDSQFVGMGIGTSQTSATELRISQVFPDSPASEAGLARGDYLLTINGKAVADLIRTGEIGNAFGPSGIGVTVDLVWRDLGGDALRGCAFDEVSVRHGDFALVSACAQVALDADGNCLRAELGLGGAASVPLALPELGAQLVGNRLDDHAIAAAADAAAVPGAVPAQAGRRREDPGGRHRLRPRAPPPRLDRARVRRPGREG